MDDRLKAAILNSVEWTFGTEDIAERWGRVRALLGGLDQLERALLEDIRASGARLRFGEDTGEVHAQPGDEVVDDY